MPDPKPQLVEVTQADRDAAADLYRFVAHVTPPMVASMRRGDLDHHGFVQRTARHRIASIEEARRG